MFKNYTDDITYWGAPTPDGEGGETFAAPVPLKGRWEDRNDEFTTPTGESAVSRATVFLQQDVVVGGYLMLGTSAAPIPANEANAQEIRAFIKVPAIRHNWYERRALCI